MWKKQVQFNADKCRVPALAIEKVNKHFSLLGYRFFDVCDLI